MSQQQIRLIAFLAESWTVTVGPLEAFGKNCILRLSNELTEHNFTTWDPVFRYAEEMEGYRDCQDL